MFRSPRIPAGRAVSPWSLPTPSATISGAKHKRIRGMLAGIEQRHGIHGNGYVSSRMAMVWISMDGELVKAATERLVSSMEVPRWRISHS